jgi:hypothetical protein
MANRSLKPIAAVVLVYGAAYLILQWVEHDHERSCAASCAKAGFSGYEYKGYSTLHGPSRDALRPDSCKCATTGGTPVEIKK